MRRLLSIILSVLLGFQSTAIAQSKPSLIVSPLKGKNTKAAVDAISSELKKTNQVFVVDFEKVLEYVNAKQPGGREKKSPKDAIAAFEKGKKAYQNLNIHEAVESFEKSKLLYQDALTDGDSFQGLRSTKFHLAMAYLAEKKESQAKLELREMILMDHHRKETKPSEKYYSPEVRNLYQKVLKEISDGDHGNLQITTSPAQTVVFIDGSSVGKSPIELRDIPVGRHFFRFVSDKDGLEEYLEKFIGEGNNEIEFSFSKTKTKDAGNYFETLNGKKELDQTRATFLDEMGLALGADLFLFLTPLEGKVKGQLYDQRSQELSREVSAGTPQALVTQLMRSLGPDGYVVPGGNEPEDAIEIQPKSTTQNQNQGAVIKPRSGLSLPTRDIESTPGVPFTETPEPVRRIDNRYWYQKPWVWVLIGGGILAAGAGAYYSGIVSLDSKTSTVKATIP